jgi:hypothetical protein
MIFATWESDMVDLETEQRIRERAYQLWKDAGSPEGDPDQYWYLSQEIETGDTPQDLPPNGSSHPAAAPEELYYQAVGLNKSGT